MQTEKYAAGLICLNESQFIGDFLRVHYDFYDTIIICEGADPHFPKDAVTADGLSRDDTAQIIRDFPDPENKITFIQYGWAAPPTDNPDRAAVGYREGEGKCVLRDQIARTLNERGFEGIFVHCDADEFYCVEIQDDLKRVVAEVTDKFSRRRIVTEYWTPDGYVEDAPTSDIARAALARMDNHGFIDGDESQPAKVETEFPPGKIHGFRFPTVNLWRDMQTMIVGGYYDIDHTRVFRWKLGSRYEYSGRKSHNWPTSPEGKPLFKHGSHATTRTFDMIPKVGIDVAETTEQLAGVAHSKPYCLHLGFTRSGDDLRDRLEYYKARGELVSRPDTIKDREAWFAADRGVMADRGLHTFPWVGHNPLLVPALTE